MVEWVRQTVFLTSSLVGVNILSVFHVLSLNIPYGIIVMIIAIFTRYSETGSECAVSTAEIEK